MAKNRAPIDFNVSSPPLAVTNPDRADAAAEGKAHDPNYPMHLAKPDLEGAGGHGSREIAVATSAADEKRLRAQGYMSHQEADLAERAKQGTSAPAARAAKPVTARKPANRKPKAPAAAEPASN